MKLKLDFELVPDSCWYSNLRSILSKKQWDVVRREAYARANGRCMICGRKATRLEAHERWRYDTDTCTQVLDVRQRLRLPRLYKGAWSRKRKTRRT